MKNRVVDYITFTEEAKEKLKAFVKSKETASGVKVCINQKGCSGLAYKIEFAIEGKNITEFDEVVILEDDLKVYVDPKISFIIIGTQMDYIDEDVKAGFVFNNPNEKGKCGCGESFYA